MKKRMQYFAVMLIVTLLSACGGGDGGGGGSDGEEPLPQQAILALAFSGEGETVGAVEIDVNLPVGFSLPIDSNGKLTTTSLASRLPIGTDLIYNYTAPTATTTGRLIVTIIRAEGFSPGDLLRIVLPLNIGETLPAADDFMIVLTAYGFSGGEIAGYSEQVSVTQEPAP